MLAYSLKHESSDVVKLFQKKRHSDLSPDDLPNREVITAGDMWRRFTSFTPKKWIWAGHTHWGEEWGTLTILYYNVMDMRGGGFAVWQPHEGEPTHFSWIECKHDDHAKTIGNCLTKYTCSKCGTSYEVDSSG